MAIVTDAAVSSADVGANGLRQLAEGSPVLAAALNALFKDLQAAAMYGLLAGVLEGGVCTVIGLTVTVPSGTRYFARQVWKFDAAGNYPVSDDAVTYLWGCSDGIVRPTVDANPPSGFDSRTACLLTKATAASGVATLDNTLQWKARQTDATNRKVTEGGIVMDYANKRLDVSAGTLIVPVLTADPASPLPGMVWVRSDTNELRMRVGSTTRLATGEVATA